MLFRAFTVATFLPLLFSPASFAANVKPSVMPGAKELVMRDHQFVGDSIVLGSWHQQILARDGTVAYDAGEIDTAPPAEAWVSVQEAALRRALPKVERALPGWNGAVQQFPPRFELDRGASGEWRLRARLVFLPAGSSELTYALVGTDGAIEQTGVEHANHVDGQAQVYPEGPRLSGLATVTLPDLVGNGTLTGRLLNVISAIGLQVWSPDQKFVFPVSDRRFDLVQAYYTISRGYAWLKENIGAEVSRPVNVRLHVGEGGRSNAAFYHDNTIFLGSGDGVLYRDLLLDPSVLLHEASHALIDAYAGLPSEGEGGSFNEGFADLFAALILDNPHLGEVSYVPGPYRRTLENRLKAYENFQAGVYQNGSIIGGTFWDMKPTLGSALIAQLAFRTLVRLGAGARFDDFPEALQHAAQGLLSDEQRALVMGVARNRGWRVP